MLVANKIFPYMGVEVDEQATKIIQGVERHFRLITYQAYNAFGLIGPEKNGVAIFDLDSNQVLCDEMRIQPFGYVGASDDQRKFLSGMLTASGEVFQIIVNAHRRARYHI